MVDYLESKTQGELPPRRGCKECLLLESQVLEARDVNRALLAEIGKARRAFNKDKSRRATARTLADIKHKANRGKGGKAALKKLISGERYIMWAQCKNGLLASSPLAAKLKSIQKACQESRASHVKCMACGILLGKDHLGQPIRTSVGIVCHSCERYLNAHGQDAFLLWASPVKGLV